MLLWSLWVLPTALAFYFFFCHSSNMPTLVTDPMEVGTAESAAAFGMATTPSPINHGSDILGEYADPNHPNCRRSIVASTASVDGTKLFTTAVVLKGTDGNPGCPPDGSGDAWSVEGKVDDIQETIVVDFSPKGGPPDLKGEKIPEGILWEDGNTWTRKDD